MDDTMYNAILLALLGVSILQFLRSRGRSRRCRPPGPRTLPLMGSVHHVVNTLVHRSLRDLAAVHGPIMMLKIGPMPLVVVTSRELAREVLKVQDPNFANRPRLLVGGICGYGWADIIFAPTSDYWRKIRKLCIHEVLSPKRVLSFQFIREEEVQRQVEAIRAAAPGTPVNLTRMVYDISSRTISRSSFGEVRPDMPVFQDAIKRVIGLSSGFNVPDLFPRLREVLGEVSGMKRKLREIHRTFDRILVDIIEKRRGERAALLAAGKEIVDENVVDVMLTLQQSENSWGFPITDNAIKAVVLDMFAGGTGTSGSSTEWAMSEIVRNPRVMKKLQDEIRSTFRGKETITETDLRNSDLKYLKLVMKEAIRLHPAAPLLVPRESIDTAELGGYVVPGGSRIVVNAWAISRDPRYWKDPEEFRPERFAEDGAADFHGLHFEFTPFGAGRRMCPGYNYGLAGMQMALLQLMYHFDWSLPAGVDEVDMEEAMGLGVRRKNPLMLCATPYVPSAAVSVG
ncbi:Premnaspirodiene oxygenase [Dichanthelium oligosanthes]|uniref:Premnaspirodiene oxygenase n=1 Tax=Dichanthelium oligosanthes TaxID=888268 RepID=A0A1E5VHK0_9POAL|nr:Premnaspirodiene oxygenase [Dichanthelium oligosanthes]